MKRWIDEGLYADNFSVHAYRCPLCDEHILEECGHEPRWCPKCGEVLWKALRGDEQDATE